MTNGCIAQRNYSGPITGAGLNWAPAEIVNDCGGASPLTFAVATPAVSTPPTTSIPVTSTTTTTSIPVTPTAPIIGSFTASPTTITSGQATTLAWSGITNATICSINNGVGIVSCNNGSTNVTPTTTTTYTLTATGTGASATATASVTVNAVQAVNPRISVSPGNIGTVNDTFHVDGTGFTPGGQVILGPAGFQITVTASSDGTATDRTFVKPDVFAFLPGTYDFSAVDSSTTKQSNHVTVIVQSPQLTSNVSTGKTSTLFILAGARFCAKCLNGKNTATIHRVGPSGADLTIGGIPISNTDGSFVVTGFTLAAGTWDVWASDTGDQITSNHLSLTVAGP